MIRYSKVEIGKLEPSRIPNFESPGAESAVEVERRADQCKVRESLREIAQSLSAVSGLLGVKAQVIRISEHLLEEQPGILEPHQGDGYGYGIVVLIYIL